MSGIGKIKRAGFNIAPKLMRMEGLSKYCLKDVTLKKLARQNIAVSFEPFLWECRPTDINNCYKNEILFASKRSQIIYTHASACSSYILYCEKTKIAAAVHVSPSYLTRPFFHVEMLLYGYANLIRMAPKDPVSAYISGMEVFIDPIEFYSGRLLMENYKNIQAAVLSELTERGVKIKALDVGKSYLRQELNLITGEYKAILSPPE